MKKATVKFLSVTILLVSGLSLLNFSAKGQDAAKKSPALPENIDKIVSASCMPCHSNNGGIMAKGKLNFNEWTLYSVDKQKEKAEKIYSEIKDGNMPPKSVRESRPEIIPTKEQIEIIKRWIESLNVVNK